MAKELIVNTRPYETRVALVVDGSLLEINIERKKEMRIAGNIYKGKVVRLLPGMQSAFVDIGLERAAFLYAGDIGRDSSEVESYIESRNGEGDNGFAEDQVIENGADEKEGLNVSGKEAEASSELASGAGPNETEEGLEIVQDEWREDLGEKGNKKETSRPRKDRGFRRRQTRIQDMLKEGQEILVQVSKDPIGSKGARLTTNISLAGRHVVYVPGFNHVGISRRIEEESERRRLKELVKKIKDGSYGLIVRTVSEGLGLRNLSADVAILKKVWSEVIAKQEKVRAPGLVYADLDLVKRSVRDVLTADIDNLIIDSLDAYKKLLKFVSSINPKLKSQIKLYKGHTPIFHHYEIEGEINKALAKKVWLKSGGYIVLDQTEALTTIDVNTGRYVGRKSLEETIVKTNLEAAWEIAKQLRLRNIGGIIILDFIDMDKSSNREKVYNTLEHALKKDKAKSSITKISSLGLVEMTRKRTRESIEHTMGTACKYCEGRGYTKSVETMCYEIYRMVEREGKSLRGNIMVQVQPDVADYIHQHEREGLEALEKRFKKKINVSPIASFHIEEYEIFGKK